ncbi:MAG: energy transducer TonB [Carboxylicivirga sp.]|jgi:protein TonB|nr:energy transducer TonB [Carboxylicivirga sp.]
MRAKKYRHADLERKRGIFFQVGLIVALGASLAAFEWSSSPELATMPEFDDPFAEEVEVMPVTKRNEPKKELPKPKPLKNIIIVDDVTPVIDEEPYINTEDIYESYPLPEMPPEDDGAPVTFVRVENMPEFPGGEAALLKFIANSVKYPSICIETSTSGRVYVSFVIDEKGQVVDTKIVRSPDDNLSKEALRVINSMPRWKPGRQRDQNVRVSYTLPVNFVLN